MNGYSIIALQRLYNGARKAFWLSETRLEPVALCMVEATFKLAHWFPDFYGLHGGSRVFRDELAEADMVEWQRRHE